MKPKTALIFFKLGLMLFLQFMLFAVWWVPLAAYLTNIGVEGTQKALILSSMAIGCLASPLVGTLADKYFSGEKVWGVTGIATFVVLVLFILFFRNTIVEKEGEVN